MTQSCLRPSIILAFVATGSGGEYASSAHSCGHVTEGVTSIRTGMNLRGVLLLRGIGHHPFSQLPRSSIHELQSKVADRVLKLVASVVPPYLSSRPGVHDKSSASKPFLRPLHL